MIFLFSGCARLLHVKFFCLSAGWFHPDFPLFFPLFPRRKFTPFFKDAMNPGDFAHGFYKPMPKLFPIL